MGIFIHFGECKMMMMMMKIMTTTIMPWIWSRKVWLQ